MKNDQIIIGFCGAKGSGKDTGFKLLDQLYPGEFKRIAFADPIKNTICDIFNLSIDELNILKRVDNIGLINCNDNTIYGQLSGRDLVRKIGMMMRNYDENQFNKYVDSLITNNPNTNFVITDVRFDGEVKLVHEHNGILIRVDRDDCPYDNHITERKITNVDYVIDNNHSLADYQNQLVDIINNL